MEFEAFPKIARLKRECLITEKIDGTNAQVCVTPEGQVLAGSRTRWITPEADNFGFARWVKEHEDELRGLGEGRHYGEWWGRGVQRGYGLAEKRFSLFNAWRWKDGNYPACCSVVPNLYTGVFSTDVTQQALEGLRTWGSVAAPRFMQPEGIIIYLSAARTYFKQTLDKDEEPKGRS